MNDADWFGLENLATVSNMEYEVTTDKVYEQIHPVENPELIASKQKEFEAELEKIPAADKQNLVKAQEKCPKLLSDCFKLMFLRCEVFNADVSVNST